MASFEGGISPQQQNPTASIEPNQTDNHGINSFNAATGAKPKVSSQHSTLLRSVSSGSLSLSSLASIDSTEQPSARLAG